MDDNLRKMLLDSDYQNTSEMDLNTFSERGRMSGRKVPQMNSVYSYQKRKVTQDEFEKDELFGLNSNLPKYEPKPKNEVYNEVIFGALFDDEDSEPEPQPIPVEPVASLEADSLNVPKPVVQESKLPEKKEEEPIATETNVTADKKEKKKSKLGNFFMGIMRTAFVVLILSAIGYGVKKYFPNGIPFSRGEANNVADTSTVENYSNWNPNDRSLYKTSTSAEIQQMYESRDTFVFFVGEKNDAYSQELVPILNDIASRNAFDSIEYIDREKFDKKDLDSISNVVDMYKAPSYDGDTKVTVPSIVFVKKGETVCVHHGTVPGYDPLDRTMTEAESDELYRSLESAFLVMTGQSETLYTVDQANYSQPEPEPEQTDAEISPDNPDQVLEENSAWVDSEAYQEEWQPEQPAQQEYFEEPAQTW